MESMERNQMVETIIKDYGTEAFQNHREEIYTVLRVLCFCLEFLQNQEDWGGRHARAIPLRYETDQSEWEQRFAEEYDSGLRREELLKLEEKLEQGERWIRKPIPLEKFFRHGLLLLQEETKTWGIGDCWTALMEMQMAVNGYTDYRAFLEAVYMLGFCELFGLQRGIIWHITAGDFRDAQHFLLSFRERIPEKGWGDYDSYCGGLLAELEKNRMNAIELAFKEREAGLLKAAKKAPVLRKFYRAMEEMEEAAFEGLVKDMFWAEENGHEDVPGCSAQADHRIRKLTKLWRLAEFFVYGDSKTRQRLFRYLSEEEQALLMERWMGSFYPFDLQDVFYSLRSMSQTACPDLPELEYREEMLASLEIIVGRVAKEEGCAYLLER